ncbi:MAG: hypothetical protein AB7E55_21440 [Pigmentiphaga sp.]
MPKAEDFMPPFSVVPDTPVGRDRVVAAGAGYFDTLSFLRPDEPWAPPRRFFGDFYGKLSLDTRLIGGEKIGTALVDLLCGHLAGRLLWQGFAALRFVHLSFASSLIGIKIPAGAFGMAAGSPYLHYVYDTFAEVLTNLITEGKRPGLQVTYSRRVPAPNLDIKSQGFAVQMKCDDIWGKSANDILLHASEPKEADTPTTTCQFSGDHFCYILRHAESKWQESLALRKQPKWLGILPILNPCGSTICFSSPEGIKCAIKLKAWCQTQRVEEFRQRDALVAVDGTFTRDHGVAEALSILEQHNIIRACRRPATNSRGRNSGGWYIVNPGLFTS